MKKFSFILVAVLAILVSNCKKSDNNGSGIDRAGNLLDTGLSANDILSNNQFDALKVEIGFVGGFRPTDVAVQNLIDYLKRYTFKEDVEVVYKAMSSPNKTKLSLQEVADLERENRTAYNDDKTLAVYIYFTDSASDEDIEDEGLVTLGAVYRNTSMVIYENTVRRLANQNGFASLADVESATLNHEFGHLLGLVNIGTVPVNDHEDLTAVNHCNVFGCLMGAELQFTGSGKNAAATSSRSKNELKNSCALKGNTILAMLKNRSEKGLVDAPPLDAECILDIRANGAR